MKQMENISSTQVSSNLNMSTRTMKVNGHTFKTVNGESCKWCVAHKRFEPISCFNRCDHIAGGYMSSCREAYRQNKQAAKEKLKATQPVDIVVQPVRPNIKQATGNMFSCKPEMFDICNAEYIKQVKQLKQIVGVVPTNETVYSYQLQLVYNEAYCNIGAQLTCMKAGSKKAHTQLTYHIPFGFWDRYRTQVIGDCFESMAMDIASKCYSQEPEYSTVESA